MAAVIFPDGSLVGMWRGDRKSFDVKPNVVQFEFAVTAANWKDPLSYAWGHAVKENNIFPGIVGPNETRTCGIEDPTLWLDKKGILHAVVHNWRAGGHATSADKGKTWHWWGGRCSAAAGPSSIDWTRSVWPPNVTFSSGAGCRVIVPNRRERPHMLVKDGVVTALITSFQAGGADTTWTLLQETAADQ